MLTDFDGTLSPIVEDPAAARPLPRAVELLHELARLYARVAVVSGRPVNFLSEHLELDRGAPGLLAVGLYGLERTDRTGRVTRLPIVETWRPPIEEAAAGIEAEAPAGVSVERKGLTVTVHWRRAPEAAREAEELAMSIAAQLGLHARQGRMSVELTPPVAFDKGDVVEELCRGVRAGLYAGDDLGDLPAFGALDRTAARGGFRAVRVAIADPETPAELLEAADLVVDGPAGMVELLELLARPLG